MKNVSLKRSIKHVKFINWNVFLLITDAEMLINDIKALIKNAETVTLY